MFNTELDPVGIYEAILKFIDDRNTELAGSGQEVHDIILYYVGHGGFSSDENRNYYLAIKNTMEKPLDDVSSILAIKLGSVLREKARFMRRYIILDACFSASAFKAFGAQSSEHEVVNTKTQEAFLERGAALLSAASPWEVARVPRGQTYTMFTGELLNVLREGYKFGQKALSMRELGKLVSKRISEVFQNDAVRPVVHSPDQTEGDIADIPIFPNPAWRESPLKEVANRLATAREHIRCNEIRASIEELDKLKPILEELPDEHIIDVYYVRACAESRRAFNVYMKMTEDGKLNWQENQEFVSALKISFENIKKWIKVGLNKTWEKKGDTAQNQIYKMGNDSDLWALMFAWKERVTDIIPRELRNALSEKTPEQPSPEERHGCVPKGTTVLTPNGKVEIQQITIGDDVLSFDLNTNRLIATHVEKIRKSNSSRCVRLNDEYDFTPTQPLFGVDGTQLLAKDVIEGMFLLDKMGGEICVKSVEWIKGDYEVYSLTIDHSSHNYIAYDLVCANKR